jgi:hypothetical protein
MKKVILIAVMAGALSAMGSTLAFADCVTNWSGNSYTAFGNFMTTDYGTDTYDTESYAECSNDGSNEVYVAASAICFARAAAHTWEVTVNAYLDGIWVNAFYDSGTCANNDATTFVGDQYLSAGDTISSPNGAYTLKYQTDGNLVLYNGATAVWAANCWNTCTSGWSPAGEAIMQLDGNLVVYNSSSTPMWASNTDGHSGAYLAVRNDGHIAVFSSNGVTLWHS